jgi:hypothetical protein
VKGIPVRLPQPKRRIKAADLRYTTPYEGGRQNADHGLRQNAGPRAADPGPQNAAPGASDQGAEKRHLNASDLGRQNAVPSERQRP